MKYALFVFLLFACFPACAQEAGAPPMHSYMGATKPEKTAEKKFRRQPNVEIRLPPEFRSSERKWPLLIYSHGFAGCAKEAVFLMQYLADRGYIVIAPEHSDGNCKGRMTGAQGARGWPEKPFRNPESWTDKTESDRRDDVLFALSSMLDDRQYKNYVDLDRMGLIGHSLGAYTVLGIAGAWPGWKDGRFKAVLALSPYLTPYLKNGGIRRIDIPVMYQSGSLDKDVQPHIQGKYGAYAFTHAAKYYVELDGANQFAWTDLHGKYESVITKTALQFFDRHVKGGTVAILPEGQDKPGRPVNKVKVFLKEEKEGP